MDLLENSDFRNLIVYEFFKNFALSMLGIFIPILIYSETGNLFLPSLYLLGGGLSGFLFALPVMKMINRYGFRSGLYTSYLFLLPAILLIYFNSPTVEVVLTVSFLYSIGTSFHTQSMNLEFAESSSRENRDIETAHLMSLPNIGRLLGPVAGGLASSFGGFQTMLATAFIAVTVSIIPARSITLKKKASRLELSSMLENEYLKFTPIFISRGIQAYASVAIFSLFTYIFIAGSISSGLVRSFDTVGFMIMAYLSGYVSSKYNRGKIIFAGAILAGLIYLIRIGVSTPLEAFLISIAGGLAFKLYDIPLFSKYADGAEDNEERIFYASKKTFNSLGKIITALIFLTASVIYSERIAFNAVFVLAAFSSLTMIVGDRISGEKR